MSIRVSLQETFTGALREFAIFSKLSMHRWYAEPPAFKFRGPHWPTNQTVYSVKQHDFQNSLSLIFTVNFIVGFVGSALLILLVDCSYSLRLVSCGSELELLILSLIVMVALCLLLLTSMIRSTRGDSRWFTVAHHDSRWFAMTYSGSR